MSEEKRSAENYLWQTEFLQAAALMPSQKLIFSGSSKQKRLIQVYNDYGEAAIQSISMGLGQIMGFNHKQIGYVTAKEMFENFSRDARFHIFGIFDFMTQEMRVALTEKNYTTFAKHYNGSGQAGTYGSLIEGYVEEWESLTS